MAYRVFQYPLPTLPELVELNQFLNSQRIATVQHQIVNGSSGPMLVFVVETVGSGGAGTGASTPTAKVDYRELLTAEEFAIYSRLRTARKELADVEGVPVYAIFSNAQLAEMVQRRVTDQAAMLSIPGVGKSRVEKHANHFLPILASRETGTPEADS